MPLIVEGLCQTVAEAGLVVVVPQQQGSELRGAPGAALGNGSDSHGVDGRKTPLNRDRAGHGRPRFASYAALLA